MQLALSKHRVWTLNHQTEDIRGWPVRTHDGHELGTVGELIFDSDTKGVTQVVLRDGRRLPAHELVVGDRFLPLGASDQRQRMAVASPRSETVGIGERQSDPRARTIAAVPGEVLASVPNVADISVPVIQEEFEVDTRRFATGGVHVESHVVGTPFDRDVILREERVRVDRRSVDRPISLEEANTRLREATVELAAKAEYPYVRKTTHIVEEVTIDRVGSDRTVAFREDVRRTAVEIEERPPSALPSEEQARSSSPLHTRPATGNESGMIPIIDEEIEIEKREIDAGGVRVTTRVMSRPVDASVTLHEEHVMVERHAVDQPIGDGSDAFQERVFDLPTFEEEPLLTKRARVVEEILIHKDATERVEHVHDALRHTDLTISRLPTERMSSLAYYEEDFKKNYGDAGYTLESLMPVYRFGEDLRRSKQGSDWTAVESDAKTLWEAKNPGTWERARTAIKTGWERLG